MIDSFCIGLCSKVPEKSSKSAAPWGSGSAMYELFYDHESKKLYVMGQNSDHPAGHLNFPIGRFPPVWDVCRGCQVLVHLASISAVRMQGSGETIESI